MIDESVKRQIDRWLDGDLSEGEIENLRQDLERHPDAIDFFCDRALLHQSLVSSSAFDSDFRELIVETLPTGREEKEAAWRGMGRVSRPLFWGTVTAAALGLLIFSLAFLPKVGANPAELVQRTLVEFRENVDRCYDVSIEVGSSYRRNMLNRWRPRFESKLWVRGQSFLQTFDSEGQNLVWGRDPRGSVWFSISADSVATFAADEIPETLQELCELRTLHLPTLLESLVRDCELQYVSGERGTKTILARPREGSGAKFLNAEIEIESDSLLVRRVTLERGSDRRAVATTSFVLEQVSTLDDSMYDMRYHLREDAEVLDGAARWRRRAELFREFLQRLRFPQVQPTSSPQSSEASS